MKRRKRPAPPYILGHYLARYDQESPQAEALVELATFLRSVKALTDGGSKKLESGLRGRNLAVSLTQQDVRTWAHGLVAVLNRELLTEASQWAQHYSEYEKQFDRGKSPTPNAVQRLILEWSPDLSVVGLIATAQTHPQIWNEIAAILERGHSWSCEHARVQTALRCRNSPERWLQGYATDENKLFHLEILPKLSWATLQWRVKFVHHTICNSVPAAEEAAPLLEACLCSYPEAKNLPPSREEWDALDLWAQSLFSGVLCARARSLVSLRAFLYRRETLDTAFRTVAPDSPLHRVRFGPRPGLSWLNALRAELEQLIDFRE